MIKSNLKNLFLFLLFGTASIISAHPLGNFSVNQYTRIEAGKSEVKVHQVMDFAEIPTFQVSGSIDTDKDGKLSAEELEVFQGGLTADYLSKLSLTSGGKLLELNVFHKKIATVAGEGGLPTLRLEWDLISKLPEEQASGRIVFNNSNYSERIGWREIVVTNTAGVSVYDSSAYASGLSDELRSYPENLISSPLSERSAEFSFTTGTIPENAKPLSSRDGSPAAAVPTDRLAQLIAVPEITPAIAILGLFLAFGLGAAHAMSPGHGKTVVGAYLVGSKGTAKHAAFLGLTVTVTHTLGVFALGLITLFASSYILPERLMPFLGFVSGLLVFFIGITLFKDRLFKLLGWTKNTAHAHEHHEYDGDEPHTHDGTTHTHGGSTHSHALPDVLTWRKLLALGISGGLLPCPSALVLMLSAISLGRIGYGLILTVVFSFGLAATLTAVGLIFLYIGKVMGGSRIANSPFVKALPVFSAFVVATVGAVICYNALG
ncbi:MAG: hypothetical protein ABIV48_01260 [Pyrinomonadaceae bacterium]